MPRKTSWPVCNPGKFRTPVTLLVAIPGTDPISGGVVTWGPGDNPTMVMAQVEYMHGTDLVKAGQDISISIMECTMWYNPVFIGGCRLQTPSGQWIVQSVENEHEVNVITRLTCLAIGGAT
jgi:hypothetical protein